MKNTYRISSVLVGFCICLSFPKFAISQTTNLANEQRAPNWADALCKCVNKEGDFTPVQGRTTDPSKPINLKPINRKLVGLTSCARCHQSESPIIKSDYKPAEDDSIIPNPIPGNSDGWFLGNEMTTWRKYDKHAQAYVALKGDLAQTMAKILNITENGESAVHRDVRCLSCHSSIPVSQLIEVGKPKEIGNPNTYLTKLINVDLAKSENTGLPNQYSHYAELIQYGVSCEGCHGPGSDDSNSKGWGSEHYSQSRWRTMNKEEKYDAGMWDVHSFVNKAKICASCHVGDAGQGKVVTHEMYAAGHPPLPNFEISTFSSQEPVHYQTIYRKKRELLVDYMNKLELRPLPPENLSKPEIAESSTSMLVGGLVGMIQQLRLSADLCDMKSQGFESKLLPESIEKAAASDYPLPMNWPEFSTFACFNCHHDLKVDSWRQKRTPMLKPGRPNMHEWPFTTVAIAVKHLSKQKGFENLQHEYENQLNHLFTALSKTPFGDQQAYPAACRSLADWLEDLAWKISEEPLRRDHLKDLMTTTLQLSQQIGRDYDSMRQFIWAFSVVYDEFQFLSGSSPTLPQRHVKLDGWYKSTSENSQIEAILAKMNDIMILDLNSGHFSRQVKIEIKDVNTGESMNVKPFLADLKQILPKISAYESELLLRELASLQELVNKLKL